MAMAMASPAATAAASVATATSAKSLMISATKNFSTLSRSSVGVSHLHTSFYGMSLQARSSRMSFADLSGAHSNRNLPSVAPSKLVFTVAKIKTHKASAKRFRVTGSGKIMRRQAFKQHLLSKKPTHRKRRLSKSLRVSRSDYDNVTRALPYLKVKGKLA